MMFMDKINNQILGLSKVQTKIAKFLITNPDKACFLSLKELSSEIGTAEVTIMNFSKKIGYDNYMELKKDLQAYIQMRLSPSDKIVTAISDLKDAESKLQEIIDTDVGSLNKTIQTLCSKDIKHAVEMLKKASRVYLVGENVSSTVVDFLYFRMKLLGLDVGKIDTSSYNMISMQMLRIKSSDIFMVVSFPKYSQKIIALTHYLKKEGNKMISITDRITSPIATHSQVVFACASDAVVFFNSMTAPMSISNILVSALALELKDILMKNNIKISEVEDKLRNNL
ncbi:MAG: MurR/RpiR family transcriptional regulator [Alkaliphilus sp.]